MLATLSRPFFTGALQADPTFPTYPLSPNAGDLTVPAPDTILLDGVQYAIETKEYRHVSRRTLRDSTAIAGEPTDSLFDTQGAWARYRHSWHLGMGQQLDDLGDDSLTPFRFKYAQNCHIWDNGSLTLQDGWLRADQLEAATGTASCINFANGYAIASNGRFTWECPSGTFTSPLWTQVSGMNGARQIATDGVDFYLAGGSAGLYRVVAGSGSASLLGSAVNCDNVAFAANRLLIGNGASLYEVAAAGTRTLIRTHFQSSFRWNVIFAIGSRIYVGGFAGTRGELYSLTTTDAGALVLSAEAAPLEPGEYLLNAVAYAGFAILLSNRGARFAQVGADGTLTYGPIIRAGYGDSTYKGLAVGGGYAWFTQLPGDVLNTPVQIEMDLSNFTDTLKPAYTLVGRSPTYYYVYEDIVYADPDGQGKMLVGIDRINSYIGTYGITSSELTEGYVETGLIRFGTVEEKVLVEIEVGFDPLPANTTVTVAVYDEDDTLIATGTQATDDAEILTVSLGNTSVRGCYVRLTLAQTTGGGGSSPVVRYWRMRAYPVAPPVQEWIVPIINHETVIVGDAEGWQQAQNPKTVRDAIEALWEAKTPTTYVEGDASYQVRVEDFEIAPNKWTADGKYFQSLVKVRLVKV